MSTSEDAALEDLNILLSDLRVTFNNEEQGLNVVDFTSDGVQPTGHQFRAFSDSCQEVVDQIGALERALLLSAAGRSDVGIGSTGGAVMIVENAVLRGMPSPPVSEHDTAAVRVEALSFMCSELQALRIEAYRRRRSRNGDRRKDSSERARAAAAILTLQKVLQVPTPPDANGEQDEAIMSAIAAKAKALPPPTAAQEAGALRAGQPICAGLRLTAAQRETVDKIHAAVSLDFALRRRMLLRRCDVTVQSFLRDRGDSASSAKIAAAAGKEMGDAGGQRNDLGILPEPLKARRAALAEEPRQISVEDALSAPRAVAWQLARKATGGDSTSAAVTATNMAVIGDVPHRGGRVTEARAGSAMPAWTSRKEIAAGRGG
ncbi:unnamed protein product, partial [Sphacelaria rigidula]